MRAVGQALLALSVGGLAVTTALAQDQSAKPQQKSRKEIGAIQATPQFARPVTLSNRTPGAPTAETEAWIAKDIQVGDWRLAVKGADTLIYARPAGSVRSDGVVPIHLRIEYREPLTLKQRPTLSVQADLDLDCGSRTMTGQAYGFEGQNLTGRKTYLEAADVTISRPGEKVATQNPRGEALKIIPVTLVREQCAEGHRSLAARYPGWRPLLSDEKGVRLVSGEGAGGLDRKLDLKYRIEAKEAQSTPELKWRSAIAQVKVDCVERSFTAEATLYSGAEESGSSAKLAFEGYRTPLGVRTRALGAAPVAETPAPRPAAAEGGRGGFAGLAGGLGGSGDTGPGKTLVDLMQSGGLVEDACDEDRARLAEALSRPGDPLRGEAEAWATQSLNSKGFRLPTYTPEGVMMLSDEVVAGPSGRKALVRNEFSRPIPTLDGKKVASRITVLEVDCDGRRARGVSESTFARNGARDLIREVPAAQPAWNAFNEAPLLVPYFEAICTSKTS